MNLIDMFGDSMSQDSDFAKKIAVKSEARKIERRAEDLVADIERFIADESSFISRGLCYGYNPAEAKNISEEDKKMLLNKLQEVALGVSKKVESSINDIFDIKKSEENKKEESKEEDKKEDEEQQFVKREVNDDFSNNKEKTVEQIQKEFESNSALNPDHVKPSDSTQVLTINPVEKFKFFGY